MREARTAATDKGERFEVQGPSCADHERSWQVHAFILENGMGGHNIKQMQEWEAYDPLTEGWSQVGYGGQTAL